MIIMMSRKKFSIPPTKLIRLTWTMQTMWLVEKWLLILIIIIVVIVIIFAIIVFIIWFIVRLIYIVFVWQRWCLTWWRAWCQDERWWTQCPPVMDCKSASRQVMVVAGPPAESHSLNLVSIFWCPLQQMQSHLKIHQDWRCPEVRKEGNVQGYGWLWSPRWQILLCNVGRTSKKAAKNKHQPFCWRSSKFCDA